MQQLTFCEYFDDVAPGDHRDGVQCQDVQRLSYPGASFDLVTCTEVFEHVPDDRRGFAEVRRVLAPGGLFVFTVPLHDAAVTRERARLQNGELHHIEPPVHHDDRIRGAGRVLVYRDYGSDVSTRLEEAGFGSAEIVAVPDAANGETTANVIVAQRP